MLFAQLSGDTITIPEITIFDRFDRAYDVNTELLDSLALANNISTSAASLLSRFSSVYSRTNGIGLYNAFAFRGSNSNQTVVKWNDFDISNSMLGISDLSLLAISPGSSLQIIANDHSFGAIGGTIIVKDNRFVNENGFSADITYKTLENIALGTELNYFKNKSCHSFNASIQNNSNSFKYSAGNDIKPITNSDSEIYSFNYRSAFLGENRAFQVFASYNFNDRNIPPSRYENSSDANQIDENIRIGVHHLKEINSVFIKARTGLFYDKLDYNNEKIGENSSSRLVASETALDIRINDKRVFNPSFSFIDRLNSINSSVYKVDFENIIYLRGGLEKKFGRMTAEFKLNSGFFRSEFLPLSPFLNLSYSINSTNNIIFKTGKNFRLPSYNDRFWNNRDDSTIHPEKSLFMDLRYNSNYKDVFNSGISVYYKSVKDNIMWLPENGIWEAENIENFRSYGLDVETSVRVLIRRIKIDLVQIYKYNKTWLNDEDRGILKSHALYFPQHILMANQRISGKRYFFTLSEHYVGQVFTSFDNSEIIRSWIRLDADFTRDFKIKNYLIKSLLSVENILDTDYETIKNYSLPGRVFSIGLKIKYVK